MDKIFLFWDKLNDEIEILGEDGEFYFYGEDEVAIRQGAPEKECRYWLQLCKIREVTPLNTGRRFDIFDPRLGGWVPFESCNEETFEEVCLQAGVKKHAIY